MAVKLTEATIRAARPPEGKAEVLLWDTTVVGLGLRARASGSKSWLFTYRPKGAGRAATMRKVGLGSWPSISLDAARTAARTFAGQVAAGADPAPERRQIKRASVQAITLEKAIEAYEEDLKRRSVRAVKAIISSLTRFLPPSLKKEAVSSVTRAEFVKAIDAVEKLGLPGAAHDLRRNCRSMLEFAVSAGSVQANVLAGLRRPRMTRTERLKAEVVGRALTDHEIGLVWRGVGDLGALGGLIRLGLLTGFRRGELAGLRWQDVKSDRITIPAHLAKNGQAHDVPLTPLMAKVLTAQPHGTTGVVFASRVKGGALNGWSKSMARVVKAAGVDFKPHDMRRTVRTQLSQLGVAEDIAEMCIGHMRADLVQRYDRSDAWAHRKAAFTKLNDHIARQIEGEPSSVVTLQIPVSMEARA